MARPKKEINQREFEALCGFQCTEEEICNFFNVTDKTLTRSCKETYNLSFSEVFKIKRDIGKISLRRSQWKLAEKNTAMSIWLGKQYLKQREHFPDEVDNTVVSNAITNIAELINNPVDNRTEDSINDKNE